MNPGGLRPKVVKLSIPKDILIFNWIWSDEDKEMEFYKFGFKQLYGNFEPTISDWDQRIKKFDLAGGAPSSWATTNEINFGKDLLSDFLGCSNLLWSTHFIKQADLPSIDWDLVPSIRADLHGQRIPSQDGNRIEPLDISSYFNFSSDSNELGINLKTIKTALVSKNSLSFNLNNSTKSQNKCAIVVGSEGVGKNLPPYEKNGIIINEDVSSLIFLHAAALPAENQKSYFNIPDNFDASDLLGWYEIIYEDGFKEIVPVQYGVNILEWNAGGEKSLNTLEGDTGSPQKMYCYEADAVDCSADPNKQITFFAFEWVNKRLGKKIKEVNLHGSIHFQSLQTDYGKPEYQPMPGNAIILAGISKIKKRELISIK